MERGPSRTAGSRYSSPAMGRAAERPRRAERLLGLGLAVLVAAVHALLEPVHLVTHHGHASAAAHADLHAAGGHGHADHEHDPEHDGGDHGGTGHLLESAPMGAPAPAHPPLATSWLGHDAVLPVRHALAGHRQAVATGRGDPPPRGPSASRAPPLG